MSDAPKRIQRRRTKGWRLPDGAVYVAYPSRWGSPYQVGRLGDGWRWTVRGPLGRGSAPAVFATEQAARRHAVALYRTRLEEDPLGRGSVGELAGRDLVCWCRPEWPCHADVLLGIANTPTLAARRGTAETGDDDE